METAAGIAAICQPIAGTVAEAYLCGRGLTVPPMGWPEDIGFIPRLVYGLDTSRSFPCLVAKVRDACGDIVAVWREYLDPDSIGKAPVDEPKLGLGPAAGCAVRLGGIGPKIGTAEGLLTGLAVREMINFKYPVWSCLSTSGLIGVELPLVVKHVVNWPDGDKPLRRHEGEYVPAEPAGRAASRKLGERIVPLGVKYSNNPEPIAGTDWLDVLVTTRPMRPRAPQSLESAQ
jgi:hypothetical protein